MTLFTIRLHLCSYLFNVFCELFAKLVALFWAPFTKTNKLVEFVLQLFSVNWRHLENSSGKSSLHLNHLAEVNNKRTYCIQTAYRRCLLKDALSVLMLCTKCVYICIRQLSSFRAPTLWFIDLTIATCHIQYTFLTLCQNIFSQENGKTQKFSKSAIFIWYENGQSINTERALILKVDISHVLTKPKSLCLKWDSLKKGLSIQK